MVIVVFGSILPSFVIMCSKESSGASEMVASTVKTWLVFAELTNPAIIGKEG